MKSLRTFFQIYKRIRQYPTVYSAVVVVFLFGLFIQAYMHDFNLVYITLFFVFSIAFSSGPLGILNLGYLRNTFVPSARFFVDKPGNIAVKVYNDSRSTSWAITLHGKDTSCLLASLAGEKSTILYLPYTPLKRGRFRYKNCYLESKYPLSTARLTLAIDEAYEGMAYPEPKGKSLASFLNEEETYYGEEKEFDGLREYDGTQKLSHIHWASVAKGSLTVKLFSKETRTPNLVFYFDKAGTNDEDRLSQLTLWVLECEKKRLPFRVRLPKQKLDSTKESIDEILTALATY